MLLVDCPLCDRPTSFDTAAGALDCPDCLVRLALADDATTDLAAAA